MTHSYPELIFWRLFLKKMIEARCNTRVRAEYSIVSLWDTSRKSPRLAGFLVLYIFYYPLQELEFKFSICQESLKVPRMVGDEVDK
jgi:hypothetical protein